MMPLSNTSPYYLPDANTNFFRTSAINRTGALNHAELFKRYQPILLMNPSDVPPMGLEELLRVSTLKQYLPNGQSSTVVQRPTLMDLEKFNAPHYFLSFAPKEVGLRAKQSSKAPVIYGNILETPRFKVLYYFYYFPYSGLSLDDMDESRHQLPNVLQKNLAQVTDGFQPMIHQGDCEGVQVFLRKPDLKPMGLFAFEHYGGKSLFWNNLKRIQERPIVRLHRASHASHPLQWGESPKQAQAITPELRVLTPQNDIIFSWRGRIGNFHHFPRLNQRKEFLPSVTAGHRGPVANKVTPWEVSLALNAAQQPEAAFYHYLH